MFKRIGNSLLLAALVLTTGTNWAALQSVAWMRMVVIYSERAPLRVALKETFDGQHPCCLCKAIAAAKRTEKSKESVLQSKRLEFPPVPRDFVIAAPSRFQLLPLANNAFAELLSQKPLLPPPRPACA
jgi:hypothetical protein